MRVNIDSYDPVVLNSDTGIPVVICQLTQNINQVLKS